MWGWLRKLIRGELTDEQIAIKEASVNTVVEEVVVKEVKKKAPAKKAKVAKENYDGMNKKEIETYAREKWGIELDRRLTRAKLLAELEAKRKKL